MHLEKLLATAPTLAGAAAACAAAACTAAFQAAKLRPIDGRSSIKALRQHAPRASTAAPVRNLSNSDNIYKLAHATVSRCAVGCRVPTLSYEPMYLRNVSHALSSASANLLKLCRSSTVSFSHTLSASASQRRRRR